MTTRLIDWIWNVRGSLALSPGQTAQSALDRLDPLFREAGTSRERSGDRLTFRKTDAAAQDKMSVFDGGILAIEPGATGSVLRYTLTSRSLLFCFLAPLLFLAIAQVTILTASHAKSGQDAAKHKATDKQATPTMNWIDKALGAPAPEKKDPKKPAENRKKPSTTSAYVFAGIFAILYLAGRVLEPWLVKRLFRRRLQQA